jgi:hypothetical protein
VISEATWGTETVARLTVTSRSFPARRTVSRTEVPAGPLTSEVASSELLPFRLLPFAATMRSPGFMPSRSAGDLSYTVTIRSPSGSSATVVPIPENSEFWTCW